MNVSSPPSPARLAVTVPARLNSSLPPKPTTPVTSELETRAPFIHVDDIVAQTSIDDSTNLVGSNRDRVVTVSTQNVARQIRSAGNDEDLIGG